MEVSGQLEAPAILPPGKSLRKAKCVLCVSIYIYIFARTGVCHLGYSGQFTIEFIFIRRNTRHRHNSLCALRRSFGMRLCRPRQQSSRCGADKYCPLSRIEPWFLHRPTVYKICIFICLLLRKESIRTKNIASNGPMAEQRWPHGLRRGSVVARLQGLRVRIPPWACMSVSCEYYVVR